MDVAAFVGFAASGPIDVPVPVWDQVRFEEIFGDDVVLARGESGEPVFGHLAPAVCAFFRNGGRKCYVVRVASDGAASNGFLVPGLMAAERPGEGNPVGAAALLWARSEGAWSDGLRVGAVIEQQPYTAAGARTAGDRLELAVTGAPLPQAGDLVRVESAEYEIRGGFRFATRLYLFVESAARPRETGSWALSDATALLTGREYWFEVVASAGSPGVPLEVVASALPALEAGGGTVPPAAGAGERPARWFPPGEPGALHRIVVPFEAEPGMLLEFAPADGTPGLPARLLAAVTEARDPLREELQAVLGLGVERWRTVFAREVLAPLGAALGRLRFAAAQAGRLRADRVTFGLWTVDGRGRTAELRRLGFSPLSPRYWGYLPSDRKLFGRLFGPHGASMPAADGAQPGRELWNEAAYPRFPLAASAGESDRSSPGGPAAPGGWAYFLPIGMEPVRRIEASAGRYAGATGPVEGGPAGSEPREGAPGEGGGEGAGDGTLSPAARSGLERFSAGLFLDPDLAGIPPERLAQAAFHKQYVKGEPLRRVHAVIPLEEVTLLSVPDAVHAPWTEVSPPPVRVLLAPVLGLVSPGDPAGGEARLSWTPVEPAGGGPVEYLVEEALDPGFSGIVRRVRTGGTSVEIPAGEGCPRVRYFRIRAEEGDQPGPWSNTQIALLPRRAFEECGLVLPPPPVPAAPVLEPPERLSDGRIKLAWSAVDKPAGAAEIVYAVEQAKTPDFRDAQVVYRGSGTEARTFVGDPGGIGPGAVAVHYVRVRAEAVLDAESASGGRPGGRAGNPAEGPWSNTAAVIPPVPAAGRMLSEGAADGVDAARVHIAMLNACAARGDMTCVLSIPAGYDSERAAAYAEGLAAAVGPGRREALGYGALYHPWIWMAQAGRPPRLVPPDGSALGAIARRSIERGAWVPPGNLVLRDIIALALDQGDASLARLYAAGANVIAGESRGFTLVGADTLSPDGAVRPLNVRRLLILIRKIAQQAGQEMVFDPNDAALRRRIRRRFESILSELFARGAFAGNTPDEGFRVVVDEGEALRTGADPGRIAVDLCIAPSRPLEFIRVRLIQTERDGLRLVEGAS